MNPDQFFEHDQIYDISPVISERLAVFPGDTPYSARFLLDLAKGDNLTLSSIETTVHLGAHTDAPSHYSKTGATMEQRPLHFYLGPCQVIDCHLPPLSRIRPEDLKVAIEAPRVLFKTSSFPDPDSWTDQFVALAPELISFLAQKKVCLVGLDTPSVDLANDRELLTHHQIAKHDMAILEGVVLDQVPAGVYHLIALPLPLKGADASPVRAILLRPTKRN